MAIQTIPLSQAPEYFFDRKLWQHLCDRHGHEQALEYIQGGSGSFFSVGTPDFEYGKKIYEQVLKRLVDGEIIATGIPADSSKAVSIPVGLWRTLKLDFVNCEAISKTHSFSDVRVRFKKTSGPTDSIQRCVKCLERRLEENGQEKKDILKTYARKEGFTVRDFNKAYKIVYPDQLGRPREGSR